MPEVVDLIERYARTIAAPVQTQTKVISVASIAKAGYLVATDRGDWQCPHGGHRERACNLPCVPEARRGGARLGSWR